MAKNQRPKCTGGGQAVQDDTENKDCLLVDIAQSLTYREKSAPMVADKLAEIVNLRWLSKLNDNAFKEKREKHARPVNREMLLTPKVNPDFWARLDRQTQAKDLRLSSTQSVLTHVGSIAAKATNILLKAKNKNASLDLNAMIRMNADAIVFFKHISFNQSQRRRETIHPHLNSNYATFVLFRRKNNTASATGYSGAHSREYKYGEQKY